MKVTVYLTREGAISHKAHQVGCLGSYKALDGHRSLFLMKKALAEQPVEEFMKVETVLADFKGEIKERAAVGMGHRKKFARFIDRIE